MSGRHLGGYVLNGLEHMQVLINEARKDSLSMWTAKF